MKQIKVIKKTPLNRGYLLHEWEIQVPDPQDKNTYIICFKEYVNEKVVLYEDRITRQKSEGYLGIPLPYRKQLLNILIRSFDEKLSICRKKDSLDFLLLFTFYQKEIIVKTEKDAASVFDDIDKSIYAQICLIYKTLDKDFQKKLIQILIKNLYILGDLWLSVEPDKENLILVEIFQQSYGGNDYLPDFINFLTYIFQNACKNLDVILTVLLNFLSKQTIQKQKGGQNREMIAILNKIWLFIKKKNSLESKDHSKIKNLELHQVVMFNIYVKCVNTKGKMGSELLIDTFISKKEYKKFVSKYNLDILDQWKTYWNTQHEKYQDFLLPDIQNGKQLIQELLMIFKKFFKKKFSDIKKIVCSWDFDYKQILLLGLSYVYLKRIVQIMRDFCYKKILYLELPENVFYKERLLSLIKRIYSMIIEEISSQVALETIKIEKEQSKILGDEMISDMDKIIFVTKRKNIMSYAVLSIDFHGVLDLIDSRLGKLLNNSMVKKSIIKKFIDQFYNIVQDVVRKKLNYEKNLEAFTTQLTKYENEIQQRYSQVAYLELKVKLINLVLDILDLNIISNKLKKSSYLSALIHI